MICILCIPFYLFGSLMSSKRQAGITRIDDDLSKQANILCGDSIQNYKTVASFGNEDEIVRVYAGLLEVPNV